jgi:hypothetical protein
MDRKQDIATLAQTPHFFVGEPHGGRFQTFYDNSLLLAFADC